MVSIRCKMLVKSELAKLDIHFISVDLGEVNIRGNVTAAQLEKLKANLLRSGLELMDDKKALLIDKIKQVVVEMVHYSEELPKVNFSAFLTKKLKMDYTYMAGLFSEVEGITIAHYIVVHKVERVKELIIYDGLTLTEIAFKLGYSSVSHLSSQFRKITGLTPSFFKSMKQKRRSFRKIP